MKNKLKACWRILRSEQFMVFTINSSEYANQISKANVPFKEAILAWLPDLIDYHNEKIDNEIYVEQQIKDILG